MIVINIADIHGNATPISEMGEVLSSADLILLSGDITHFGGRKEAAQIINQIRRYNSNILAVTGNCDTEEVDTFLEKENMHIHGRSIDMEDVTIFGAGAPSHVQIPLQISTQRKNMLEFLVAQFREWKKTRPRLWSHTILQSTR